MSGEQGKFAELSPDEPSRLRRDADGVVALPKQLWSAFREHGDGEFLCEVGWALGGGTAVTSRCVLSKDGDVKASVSGFQQTKQACSSSLISADIQRLICRACTVLAGDRRCLRVPAVGGHLISTFSFIQVRSDSRSIEWPIGRRPSYSKHGALQPKACMRSTCSV